MTGWISAWISVISQLKVPHKKGRKWRIVVEIVAALFVAFACGYAVRDLISRRRRAAEKRRYLERQTVADEQLLKKKILSRDSIKELAATVGARTEA
jgi:hypothetical protein